MVLSQCLIEEDTPARQAAWLPSAATIRLVKFFSPPPPFFLLNSSFSFLGWPESAFIPQWFFVSTAPEAPYRSKQSGSLVLSVDRCSQVNHLAHIRRTLIPQPRAFFSPSQLRYAPKPTRLASVEPIRPRLSPSQASSKHPL